MYIIKDKFLDKYFFSSTIINEKNRFEVMYEDNNPLSCLNKMNNLLDADIYSSLRIKPE